MRTRQQQSRHRYLHNIPDTNPDRDEISMSKGMSDLIAKSCFYNKIIEANLLEKLREIYLISLKNHNIE